MSHKFFNCCNNDICHEVKTWRLEFPVSLVAVASVMALYTGGNQLFKYSLFLIILTTILFNIILNVTSTQRLDLMTVKKRISLFFLLAALFGFTISTARSLIFRDLSLQDFGIVFIQIALPFLLAISPNRRLFVEYIGRVCVVFGLVDGLVNVLALLGLVDITISGRLIGDEIRLRYAGLSGNSHAAGFVAFVASLYLTSWVKQQRRWVAFIGLLVLMLLASLYLIDARRYLAFTVVGIMVLIFWKHFSRIGLIWLMSFLSIFFLGATFLTVEKEPGNALRATLLMKGLKDARDSPIFGNGPTYLNLANIEPVEDELAEVGVTESQLLDFVKNYGFLASSALLCAVIMALYNRRNSVYHLELTLLALLTSELFYGGSVRGILGSLLFFACLLTTLEREAK